jgi:protein TonB
MKLTSFFVVSVAFHVAAALVYPLSYSSRQLPEFVPVTILSFGEAGGSTGAKPASSASGGAASTRTRTKSKPATRPIAPSYAPKETFAKPQVPKPSTQLAAKDITAVAPANLVMTASEKISGVTMSDGAIDVMAKAAGNADGGTGDGGTSGASGRGGKGSGLGIGIGAGGGGFANGDGNDIGVWGPQHVQPEFRHTPRPVYPEAARKDGKEGRVLLRVLVDEEGQSKIVEVNRSSGSPILDQAAVEAVKRWRFSPARYGDVPAASWVKIPVDFRLTETKE